MSALHQKIRHDSALKHVTGRALYVDDITEPIDTLHAQFGTSPKAHATIKACDLSEVKKQKGVRLVLTAQDIPGKNDISPVDAGDDPLLAEDKVSYCGQPMFAVIADTWRQARHATKHAKLSFTDKTPTITLQQAIERQTQLLPEYNFSRGDAKSALATSPLTLTDSITIGGQEHFYLEGQVALAIPGEDQDMLVYSSTQHPTEVQHKIAHVLNLPAHAITVETRRMGGGFGGKESQAAACATIAALAATILKKPIKIRLDRDDDFLITGKRHDFHIDYHVGFNPQGEILALDVTQHVRCGASADLSAAVADRAMFHATNCYYIPNIHINSKRYHTHSQSNTAFRGFGGPQGMLAMERIIDHIAFTLNQEPTAIREKNFYDHANTKNPKRNITPFHMKIDDCIIHDIVKALKTKAHYQKRRQQIHQFNQKNALLKRGIALTPVQFGISFTATHFNQAGALVHVYTDGSVHLNHGGTEMGQGLFTKIAQIVANVFALPLEKIKISPTNTGKVPNTSATAASSGADLNGMAAQQAALTIRNRIQHHLAEQYQTKPQHIEFSTNGITITTKSNQTSFGETLSFKEAVQQCYQARVPLSSTGFYATPEIHWNRQEAQGKPFYYYAYGAAIAETIIDTLTGEYRFLRADLLHDAGTSLNPALDLGQIEGGYIQGVGWLTTEELAWDKNGKLTTHAPSTYKIPTASDRPAIMNIELYEPKGHRNRKDTIHRSKAVGEPPLMLANAAFLALSDAIAATNQHKTYPALNAPATPERVLNAIEALKNKTKT